MLKTMTHVLYILSKLVHHKVLKKSDPDADDKSEGDEIKSLVKVSIIVVLKV